MAAYRRTIRPNRSLDAAGRRVCLGAIAAGTLLVATAATLIGAWPVLPFAGLEVGLVLLAFRHVTQHSDDFECLEIDGDAVRFTVRRAAAAGGFCGNRQWMALDWWHDRGRCRLALCYAGRREPIGQLLSDAQRTEWAQELAGMLGVTGQRGSTRTPPPRNEQSEF